MSSARIRITLGSLPVREEFAARKKERKKVGRIEFMV
jgi:hypothetical protein